MQVYPRSEVTCVSHSTDFMEKLHMLITCVPVKYLGDNNFFAYVMLTLFGYQMFPYLDINIKLLLFILLLQFSHVKVIK